MERDVAKRLTDAVLAFNAHAVRARRQGLPFVVEARVSWTPGGGRVSHLDVVRSMPVSADLLPEGREEQCATEIALLGAAKEVNRLADEAGRRNVTIELRVSRGGRMPGAPSVELVLPGLL